MEPSDTSRSSPRLAVVAPVFNEAENIGPLIDEVVAALADAGPCEIIVVDDCSSDGTADALAEAKTAIPALRVLRHARNAGQSRALRSGVLAAKADIIVTLDGDGQNDPADIPKLLERLQRADAPPGLAMVAGQRRNRKDTLAKRWASRAANAIRQKLLADGAADTGCGLKAFRREAFLHAPYFDHLHRYLPAMMIREGFKVEYCDVGHRPRRFGVSKYTNWQRAAVAVRDILGVLWLKDRARSPGGIEEL